MNNVNILQNKHYAEKVTKIYIHCSYLQYEPVLSRCIQNYVNHVSTLLNIPGCIH